MKTASLLALTLPLAVGSIVPAQAQVAGAPASADPVADMRRLLLQGDIRAMLDTVGPQAEKLPGRDAIAFGCIRERFANPPAAITGPAAPFLAAYRSYWRGQMLGQAAKPQAEAALLAQLNALLPGTGWDRTSLDATTSQVKVHLDGQGVHTLTGVTHPFYELMLWTREDRKEYTVQLPEHTVQVPVVLLDGFMSRGWLSYASCERTGAGGWTANGVLYALADNYDLEGEKFKVTFLGHEGQHFADNRDFPKLAESELEYRAKLTELALSSDPAQLLEKFRASAQRGRRVPHAHAEYFVARNMDTQLAGAAPDRARLRVAARALLAASSAQARAAGAATVIRLLSD